MPTATDTRTPTPTIPSETGATVTIRSTSANLRAGPGSTYEVVGTVMMNETFEALAQATVDGQPWYLIRTREGREFWVWSQIVTLNPADAQLPEATDIPAPPTQLPTPFLLDPLAAQGFGAVVEGPSIISVSASGRCDAVTYSVTWTDPTGDGARIVIGGDTGERTEVISGGSGTLETSGYSCTGASCTAIFVALDAAGNRSQPFRKTVSCRIGG